MEHSEQTKLSIVMNGLWLCSGYTFRQGHIFEIWPHHFLQFSKSDLNLKTKRSSVNALSNAKRSIECQVDTLLYVFGHYKKAKKERWNFPKKILFLKSLEITGPNILNKINQQRNRLEHEYKYPQKDEVENAIDVAELFLTATEKFTEKYYDNFDIEYRDKDTNISISFNEEVPEFEITHPKEQPGEWANYKITENHPLFFSLLKRYAEAIKLD